MAYWYRRVFLLAIPLIFSNLTQPLLSTVDTVLSGHLPGAAALGGVAVGGIFFNTIYWTFGFLRMGTTGLVAQAHGARRHDQLRLHFLRALASSMGERYEGGFRAGKRHGYGQVISRRTQSAIRPMGRRKARRNSALGSVA